jgi:hypothetical protein
MPGQAERDYCVSLGSAAIKSMEIRMNKVSLAWVVRVAAERYVADRDLGTQEKTDG